MCGNPVETRALYKIKNSPYYMNEVLTNWPVPSTRSLQGIPKWGYLYILPFLFVFEQLNFFFFNDNLEILIRSLLVIFQVKTKTEGVGEI